MTLTDFASATIHVLEQDGIDGYLPTLAFPATSSFQVIQGIPGDVDHREAIQNVITRSGSQAQEFFFAVRSAPDRVTAGHFRPGHPTQFLEIAPTPQGLATRSPGACDWWKLS